MNDPFEDFARTVKAIKDASKADTEKTMKALREASQHDVSVRAMVAQIGTALSDAVVLFESMAGKEESTKSAEIIASAVASAVREQKPPVVNVAPAVVNVEPVMRSDWKTLRVEMAVNASGVPTGSMTITKVK